MILVLVEEEAGEVSTLSLEALTFARAVADSAGTAGSESTMVHAVAVAELPSGFAETVGGYGVAVLHHATDQRLAGYSAAAWASSVVDVIRAESPTVVLAGASPRGNEILAHVAARLDLRMAANVTTAAPAGPDGGGLVVRRQVMGGAALEEVLLDGVPALLTLAGHAIEPTVSAGSTPVRVVPFAPTLTPADLVARVRRTVPVATAGADLTKARVVVGAGRGVGAADRFADVLELAERLGGALGVSRVVTSLGWRPHHEQVGQTGSRITPDVYIACGISGAIQHWAGCSAAKTIIAINTDVDAPMVTKAHYAVIGDLHEIVPAINAELATRSAP